VLGGIAVLGVRFRPYWLASYRGEGADLRGAVLVHASLPSASLMWANLREADLQGADLRCAKLDGARLCNADLRNANLQHANMGGGCTPLVDLTGADLRGADLRETLLESWSRYGGRQTALLTGARYDARTRWPAGFDPAKHGAVKLP
jgi:uncharacterized protein YjbI with pentapeptide repeats